MRASPTDQFFTKTIFPHVGDMAPRPAEKMTATYGGLAFDINDNGGEGGGATGGLGGHLYVDGSAGVCPVRGMARAACAVIEVDAEGQLLRSVRVPVPRHLPQTSQAAEYMALACAHQLVTRSATVHSDCKGVADAVVGGPAKWTRPAFKYGGIMLDTLSNPSRSRLIEEVKWVKAHRAERGGESEVEARHIRGNTLADAEAKAAVLLHPKLAIDQQSFLDFYIKSAPLVARAVGTAMAMFPTAKGRMTRAPRPRSERQAAERSQHWRRWELGAWRCAVCSSWVRGRKVGQRRQRETCHGNTSDETERAWTAAGHRLC